MVTTNKVYEEERKRRYPDTYDQNYPNERTRTDHDAYKARTTEANFATKRYEKLYAKERSDYRAYGESDPARYAEEKAHYNQLGGLFPDQHERPIEPAQERHETTLR